MLVNEVYMLSGELYFGKYYVHSDNNIMTETKIYLMKNNYQYFHNQCVIISMYLLTCFGTALIII